MEVEAVRDELVDVVIAQEVEHEGVVGEVLDEDGKRLQDLHLQHLGRVLRWLQVPGV